MKKVIVFLILIFALGFLPKTSTAATSNKAEFSMSNSSRTKRPSFKQKKTHNWGGTAKVKRCKRRR